jgi:hypothetical protein
MQHSKKHTKNLREKPTKVRTRLRRRRQNRCNAATATVAAVVVVVVFVFCTSACDFLCFAGVNKGASE